MLHLILWLYTIKTPSRFIIHMKILRNFSFYLWICLLLIFFLFRLFLHFFFYLVFTSNYFSVNGKHFGGQGSFVNVVFNLMAGQLLIKPDHNVIYLECTLLEFCSSNSKPDEQKSWDNSISMLWFLGKICTIIEMEVFICY